MPFQPLFPASQKRFAYQPSIGRWQGVQHPLKGKPPMCFRPPLHELQLSRQLARCGASLRGDDYVGLDPHTPWIEFIRVSGRCPVASVLFEQGGGHTAGGGKGAFAYQVVQQCVTGSHPARLRPVTPFEALYGETKSPCTFEILGRSDHQPIHTIPTGVYSPRRKGLCARSRPIVVCGPWPLYTTVESGSVSSWSAMEASRVSVSPPGRSVLPMEP